MHPGQAFSQQQKWRRLSAIPWRAQDVYGTVSFTRDIPGLPTSATAASRFADRQAGLPCLGGHRTRCRQEAAILAAVVELLNETSYESVTMDAVAARAKPRRPPSTAGGRTRMTWSSMRCAGSSRPAMTPCPIPATCATTWSPESSSTTRTPFCFAATTAALKGLVYAASSDPELAAVIRAALEDAHLEGWQIMLRRAFSRAN